MNIIKAPPPNYAEIIAAFPFVATQRGVFFCYGGTIFNPDGFTLRPSLVAHEREHSKRQNGNPAAWWERYISDVEFRFNEELAAHRVEYASFSGLPRNQRRLELRQIARRLAGPLYGRLVSVREAKKMICAGDTA